MRIKAVICCQPNGSLKRTIPAIIFKRGIVMWSRDPVAAVRYLNPWVIINCPVVAVTPIMKRIKIIPGLKSGAPRIPGTQVIRVPPTH